MALNDPLANALSAILNAEKSGKDECTLKNVSNFMKNVLDILNRHHFVGGYEEFKDNTGTILKLNLLGSINKCGVIKPRFAVQKDNYEKFEKRFLPARNMGIIIVSTSQGLMTHRDAKEKQIGGKVIAYCY